MLWLIVLLVIAILGLCLWISYTDITKRTIHNEAVIALSVFVVPLAWLLYHEIFILPAVITFAVGFLLFMADVIGGGDVKMLSVLMLAIPNEAIMPFFFFTTLAGLVVIILGFLISGKSFRQKGVPYGVAISIGFMLQLMLYFPFHQFIVVK